MNCDTGHLVSAEALKDMTEEERRNYEQVPSHLSLAAQLELMGKDETYVGKSASGGMSKHMLGKRKKKRQIAKASRRKNRCHC